MAKENSSRNWKFVSHKHYVYVWYHSGYVRIMVIHRDFPKVTLYNFCKIMVNHLVAINFIQLMNNNECLFCVRVWNTCSLSISMDIQYLLNVYDVNLTTLFTHFFSLDNRKKWTLNQIKNNFTSLSFFLWSTQTFDY
jgi:hypothetical protein